jgi:hypothetical protein
VNDDGGDFDAGLRESAFFTLTGAQIFGSNTSYLSSSAGGDGRLREGSGWPFWTACAVWGAVFAYLALSF